MPSNAIKRLAEAATGSAETRVCSRLLTKPFSRKELCGEATDVGGDVFFFFSSTGGRKMKDAVGLKSTLLVSGCKTKNNRRANNCSDCCGGLRG